jgi:hypothetical protein
MLLLHCNSFRRLFNFVSHPIISIVPNTPHRYSNSTSDHFLLSAYLEQPMNTCQSSSSSFEQSGHEVTHLTHHVHIIGVVELLPASNHDKLSKVQLFNRTITIIFHVGNTLFKHSIQQSYCK